MISLFHLSILACSDRFHHRRNSSTTRILFLSRRIIKNQPLIPNHISKIAKDFILKLLTKNPKRRLGAKGLEDVKRHPFFGSDLDWDAIAHKRLPAPIKPKIKDEMDTSNFADEFTRLPLTDSPGLAPPTESLFRVNDATSRSPVTSMLIPVGLFVYLTDGSLRSYQCSERGFIQSPSSHQPSET